MPASRGASIREGQGHIDGDRFSVGCLRRRSRAQTAPKAIELSDRSAVVMSLLTREAPMSSKQYREFARECLQWAEESASEEDRRHFIDMAKAWVHAAAELRDLSEHSDRPPSR